MSLTTRLRFWSAWLLYGWRRCDAASHNSNGESLMDNGLSVYRCKPRLPSGARRCRGRAVSGVRVFWGSYVALICREHAGTLAHGTPDWRHLPDGTAAGVPTV